MASVAFRRGALALGLASVVLLGTAAIFDKSPTRYLVTADIQTLTRGSPVAFADVGSPAKLQPRVYKDCASLREWVALNSVLAEAGTLLIELKLTSNSDELVSVIPGRVTVEVLESRDAGPWYACTDTMDLARMNTSLPENWGITRVHLGDPPIRVKSDLELVGRALGNGDDRVLKPHESALVYLVVVAPPPDRRQQESSVSRMLATLGSKIAVRVSVHIEYTVRTFETRQNMTSEIGPVWLSGLGGDRIVVAPCPNRRSVYMLGDEQACTLGYEGRVEQ